MSTKQDKAPGKENALDVQPDIQKDIEGTPMPIEDSGVQLNALARQTGPWSTKDMLFR